jgi:hypothetical protein
MRRRAIVSLLAAGLANVIASSIVLAQDTPVREEIREMHAILLGLAREGQAPEKDGSADIYYSIVDNPDAPRLVTRLEVSAAPCRSRSISALQFPGHWASLTLGLTDLTRITSVVAYASVDDLIGETNAIAFDDPAARLIVMTGTGLQCGSRISLDGEGKETVTTCGDRLDISMLDEEQRMQGLSALETVATVCKVTALQK